MLEAAELECVRGRRTLFRGLSFSLRGGELLRVAGANGRGKTSLLRILCGLLLPTSGEVRWQGARIGELREEYSKQLVYLGHAAAIKDDLSPAENLSIACTLAGTNPVSTRVREALGRFGLAGAESVPARFLSQGQRRRAALARLLLAESAPLWLLDEPLAALDAEASALVGTLIAAHVARGGAVAYSSHQEARIEAAPALVVDLDAAPMAGMNPRATAC